MRTNDLKEGKTMMLCTSLHTMYIFIAILLVPGAGGTFPSEIIKNVLSLSGNFLNDIRYYINKNLLGKAVSSTWITSVFITICLLEIVQFVANLGCARKLLSVTSKRQ